MKASGGGCLVKEVSPFPADSGRDGKPEAVSVVIPCYNYALYLPQAVESVVNQTYRDVEIIIVNDGSSDGTLEAAGRLAEKYRNIKVIDQENLGVSESRNNGIRAASGRYIMLLDADDVIRPTCIEELAAVLDRFPDIAVAHPLVETFGLYSKTGKPDGRAPMRLCKENTVCGCSMFRREAWEAVGGYKKIMRLGNEDWEFWVSVAEAGYKFMQVEKPLYLWRRHREGSRSNGADKVRPELLYTMRCLHPGFFAPAITRYLGADAARRYFRVRMPAERAFSRLLTGVLYPVHRALKHLFKTRSGSDV